MKEKQMIELLMKLFMLALLVIFLIIITGCNSPTTKTDLNIIPLNEAESKEQYCQDRNMTFDNTYLLQPNWTRCCTDYEPKNTGFYTRECHNYEYIQVEKEEDTNYFIFSNNSAYNNTPLFIAQAIFGYNNSIYETRGYNMIKPEPNKKLIFLECENSTLRINKTMLWCE